MQYIDGVLAPGFTQQYVRNWDQNAVGSGNPVVIRYINPSSGTFTWTQFDAFFSAAAAADQKVVFTLGQPADWMITRSALGGANLGGKANMCPTGATELTTNYLPAITAIVERAKNTHGMTGIVWELWNEIEGPGMLAVAELGALAAMAKAVTTAIRAVDATAVVLTPSARDDDTAYFVGNFLALSDGAGGKGGDWVDGIAFHFYGLDQGWTYKYTCDVYRANAVNAGYPSLPLYITENGMLRETEGTGHLLQRRMLTFAALGVKSFIAYATDSNENPLGAYSEEWNEAAAAIAGKTITSCVKNADGTVTAIVNGVSITY